MLVLPVSADRRYMVEEVLESHALTMYLPAGYVFCPTVKPNGTLTIMLWVCANDGAAAMSNKIVPSRNVTFRLINTASIGSFLKGFED
jgi:hypothetical protein